MNLTQLLTFEVGTECNLSRHHADRCPVAVPTRFDAVDTTRQMTDADIITAIKAAVACGFEGMVSYHSYCEPMLYLDRIEHIAASTPEARHLLWTNGTMLFPSNASRLGIFSKVIVSNYTQLDWRWLEEWVPELKVVRGHLDARRLPGLRPNTNGCFRLYHELIIDHYGNWRMCCNDYMGGTVHLNLHTHGMGAIAAAHASMREATSSHPQPPSTPDLCRFCRVLGRGEIHDLVGNVFAAIHRDMVASHQPVAFDGVKLCRRHS